jgi:hypothetical protein
MDMPLIKYQIVISHEGGAQMIMSSHSTLEDAQKSYRTADMGMKLGRGSIIMRDPDWNELELQRVEVLEG